MNEVDIERSSASAPRDRKYGTFFQSKTRIDLEKDIEDRSREWERGAFSGALLSAVLSLLVVTTFVVVAYSVGYLDGVSEWKALSIDIEWC